MVLFSGSYKIIPFVSFYHVMIFLAGSGVDNIKVAKVRKKRLILRILMETMQRPWKCLRKCSYLAYSSLPRCSVAHSCLTLCDPRDCSQRCVFVHGISQARILEWIAISSSRGSSQPRDQTRVSSISRIVRQILYHCTSWEAPYCTTLNANGFFF